MTAKLAVKIFVSAHKPSKFIESSEIFQPIQVGAARTDQKLPGCLYDDEGENISALNPRFCELTAAYSAWKNCDADYIGLFHYRRYLDFNASGRATDEWGSIVADTLDESTIREFGLDDQTVYQTVTSYDIVVSEPKNIRTMPGMGNSVREQFSAAGTLYDKDLETMLQVLGEKYPDYLPYAKQYLRGHLAYFNNLFVMKRAIFDQYMTWLFDILFACDERSTYDGYSAEALRTPGHLAERLLGIWLAYQRAHQPYKIKELPTVVFLRTDPEQKILPAFAENNHAIAFSANDFYVPYLATVLASIREHASAKHNYDILVMEQDISPMNQARLKRIFARLDNFSLRFIDITGFASKFSQVFLRGHFTVETWFRLLLPELLPEYDQILYLDADLVTQDDVAKIAATKLGDNLLAACRDADTAGLYNGYVPSKKNYIDHVLRLTEPYNYFQAGVCVFNLAAFRQEFTTEQLLELATSRDWELLDQDVLNVLAAGRVKFLDMAWNVMYDWNGIRKDGIISFAPQELRAEYLVAYAAPKIIHYAGPDKPWQDPSVDYGDGFWQAARESGYYEILLERLLGKVSKPSLKSQVKTVGKRLFPVGTSRGRAIRKLAARVRK